MLIFRENLGNRKQNLVLYTFSSIPQPQEVLKYILLTVNTVKLTLKDFLRSMGFEGPSSSASG